MTPKPKGRPPKKKRNISGLRNQPKIYTVDNPLTPIFESAEPEVDGDCDDINHSLPHDIKDLASSEQEDDGDLDSDFESDDEWKGLTSIDLGKRLAALSCKIDNDDEDQDWIPYKLRRQKGKKKGEKQYYNESLYVDLLHADRPKTYIKGPDVMNKSARTQQHYAAFFKNQTQLDAYLAASEGGSSIPQV